MRPCAPDMSEDDPFAALRKRACDLADTARFEAWPPRRLALSKPLKDWASLSAELVDEGSPYVIARRLTHHWLFQLMQKNRILAGEGPKLAPGLAAVTQHRVGQHTRHHRFAHGRCANADARIVSALGADLGIGAAAIDRAARREDR